MRLWTRFYGSVVKTLSSLKISYHYFNLPNFKLSYRGGGGGRVVPLLRMWMAIDVEMHVDGNMWKCMWIAINVDMTKLFIRRIELFLVLFKFLSILFFSSVRHHRLAGGHVDLRGCLSSRRSRVCRLWHRAPPALGCNA